MLEEKENHFVTKLLLTEKWWSNLCFKLGKFGEIQKQPHSHFTDEITLLTT